MPDDYESAAWPPGVVEIGVYAVAPWPVAPAWPTETTTTIAVGDTMPRQAFALRNIIEQLEGMAGRADREEVAMAYREAKAVVQDHLDSL
jgi:hypothetical protein